MICDRKKFHSTGPGASVTKKKNVYETDTWLATYCKIPVNSTLYFLYTEPQKFDKDWSHSEMLAREMDTKTLKSL